jgi:hypothetical protein
MGGTKKPIGWKGFPQTMQFQTMKSRGFFSNSIFKKMDLFLLFVLSFFRWFVGSLPLA